jgi:hypothetical protein
MNILNGDKLRISGLICYSYPFNHFKNKVTSVSDMYHFASTATGSAENERFFKKESLDL